MYQPKNLSLIGGRPRKVYEAPFNPGLGRCGMWDFPTLPLMCRPIWQARPVGYTRTMGSLIPCTNPKAEVDRWKAQIDI